MPLAALKQSAKVVPAFDTKDCASSVLSESALLSWLISFAEAADEAANLCLDCTTSYYRQRLICLDAFPYLNKRRSFYWHIESGYQGGGSYHSIHWDECTIESRRIELDSKWYYKLGLGCLAMWIRNLCIICVQFESENSLKESCISNITTRKHWLWENEEGG